MAAACVNDTKLIGYVCTDVQQIDENPIGIRFKLVTNETFFSNKKQEYVKNSEAHLIKSWKQNANFALNNIKTGDYLYVSGKIHYHVIITDEDKKIRNPEIIASQITKLNRNNKGDSQKNEETEETVKEEKSTKEEEEEIERLD